MSNKTGHRVFGYQILARMPEGKLKQETFCRSCGEPLPKRRNSIGIQFFYCQPNCAFDAAIHAAMKGYASPAYCKARKSSGTERRHPAVPETAP